MSIISGRYRIELIPFRVLGLRRAFRRTFACTLPPRRYYSAAAGLELPDTESVAAGREAKPDLYRQRAQQDSQSAASPVMRKLTIEKIVDWPKFHNCTL